MTNNKEKTNDKYKPLYAKLKQGTEGYRKEAFIPRAIRMRGNELLGTEISKKDYRGTFEIEPFGKVAKWESLGIEYLIRVDDLEKMKYEKPLVYVEQKKNIYLLIDFIIQQQRDNEDKKAKTVFTKKDYLRGRGYTDEEIKKGGKSFELIERVLDSGAYTNFRRRYRSKDSKRGVEILGSFYSLIKKGNVDKKTGEIKGKNTQYFVSFNSPYSDYIEEGLKERKQFYRIPLKLIADRNVDKNPVLFNFIDYLIYVKGGKDYSIKIENLLKKIGVKKDSLERQPKCFEIFKKCLVYTSKNYKEELERITILNEDQSEKMPLSSLETLEKYTLQDFKDLLKAINGRDFRKCYIIFYHGKERIKIPESATTIQDNSELVDEILRWADDGIDWAKVKMTREGTEKYLEDILKKHLLSLNKLNELFRQKAGENYPNAFMFLTKILPQEIKEKKAKDNLINLKKNIK